LVGDIFGGRVPDDMKNDRQGDYGAVLDGAERSVLEHVAKLLLGRMPGEKKLELLLGDTALSEAGCEAGEEEEAGKFSYG